MTAYWDWSKQTSCRGIKMEIELIILGILFLLRCIMDYAEFRDDLRDMHQDDEEESEEES